MKQYIRYITLLFLTLCVVKVSTAQDEMEEPVHAVKVIGRAYKDSIPEEQL